MGKLPRVPRLHHVNLGVPVGGAEAEETFLLDVLGYRRVAAPPELTLQARWFESEDGKQIHLSEDHDHRPAARAHVAVEVEGDLSALEARLEQAGLEHSAFDGDGLRVVFCQDPAGNRWELRGAVSA
jgi:catechol 2,3-dioxygenase-like lactoylglutathione lyase family enzyme